MNGSRCGQRTLARVREPTVRAVDYRGCRKEVLSVTHLRQLMIEELQGRNFARGTIVLTSMELSVSAGTPLGDHVKSGNR